MNCLKTVLPWIEHERSQIRLPDRMIRLRLAAVHSWAGDVLLNTGETSQARVHLCESLRHQVLATQGLETLGAGLAARHCPPAPSAACPGLKVKPGVRKHESIAAAKAG